MTEKIFHRSSFFLNEFSQHRHFPLIIEHSNMLEKLSHMLKFVAFSYLTINQTRR